MLVCVACQYALNEQLTLDSPRTAVKTSKLAPPKNILFFQITDSRYQDQNTSNSFGHLNSIIANMGIDVVIFGVAKQRSFGTVRNSHRTYQLAISKHFFLSNY